MSIQSISGIGYTQGTEEFVAENEQAIGAAQYRKAENKFEDFDKNGDGMLDENEALAVAKKLGKEIVDVDKDGKITIKDFKKTFYF